MNVFIRLTLFLTRCKITYSGYSLHHHLCNYVCYTIITLYIKNSSSSNVNPQQPRPKSPIEPALSYAHACDIFDLAFAVLHTRWTYGELCSQHHQ